MIEQVGRFVGMFAADVVHAFRGRQAVPCSVDWDEEPDGNPDVSGVFVKPYGQKNDDDGCGDCEGHCCLTTDTLNEWGK